MVPINLHMMVFLVISYLLDFSSLEVNSLLQPALTHTWKKLKGCGRWVLINMLEAETMRREEQNIGNTVTEQIRVSF